MGEIVFAGIAPHDFDLVPKGSAEIKSVKSKTAVAMENMVHKFYEEKADTLIVLTPHGLRVKNYTAIYTTEYCSGRLITDDQSDYLKYKCAKDLATNILTAAEKRNSPVVGCNFGALEGPASNMAMDWGTYIPLWFMKEMREDVEVVVIGPTRERGLDTLYELGRVIGLEIEKSNKRVGIIASADQGHCHSADGPYGYHPASELYDTFINKCLNEGKLGDLLKVDMSIVEEGKPDSLWQMVIMAGALERTDLSVQFYSYEVLTYFGMTVAGFFRRR